MEKLAIYDCKFVYDKGEDNSVADALSCYPYFSESDPLEAENFATHPYLSPPASHETAFLDRKKGGNSPLNTVAALANVEPAPAGLKCTTQVSIDNDMIQRIIVGYRNDPWCTKLILASCGMPEVQVKDGLWFIGEKMIVPAGCGVCEDIFILEHDTLGHFGFFKTYESIYNSYFWPGMWTDLENGYIPGCVECQYNKGPTAKPAGPLHPLPVPDECGDSVAMDFIGPLPEDKGFNCILSMTDCLNSDACIIPTHRDIMVEQLALLFFNEWYCENALPLDFITDMDKLFVSKFWKHLMILTGVKHKCAMAYHPKTDGASEHFNKTINQLLHYHVEQNQKGWVCVLPHIRFQSMSTANKSTGFSLFQLKTGHSLHILPPLVDIPVGPSKEYILACTVIDCVTLDISQAKDNLMVAKIVQSYFANSARSDKPKYVVGDKVMLNTINRCHDYRAAGEKQVAKFMLPFNGPYLVIDAHGTASMMTLDMPNMPNTFPTFHTSLIKP